MKTYIIDNKGNKIVGHIPNKIDSNVEFIGQNNILYCEENVTLKNTNLVFEGNNSLVYLGNGYHKVKISIYNDSVCHLGRGIRYTNTMIIIVSEHKHCFIGDNCIISSGVVVRNADAHLIYDCTTNKRINQSKSIYIGDHVWIGQNVFILKNSKIDSGSIIGANSCLVGRTIPHNSIYAGNPARKVKSNVFWDKTITHPFDEQLTEDSLNYSNYIDNHFDDFHNDYWIYEYDTTNTVEWTDIEMNLSSGCAIDKCNYLINLNKNKTKNRFVHTR